jgi:DNA-binding CsgD family transcriptional regulator
MPNCCGIVHRQNKALSMMGDDGGAAEAVRHGREHYARRAWAHAYAALRLAGEEGPLSGDDCEHLSIAAYMTGRQDEYLAILERAYNLHLESGAKRKALRCAFWLRMGMLLRGEPAHASGWLSRAERLLEAEEDDCAGRGYLLLTLADRHRMGGGYQAAGEVAAQAARIGDECGDADLSALARHTQGRCLLVLERVEEGLALLDDAMLNVTSGAPSPIVTGIIYCGVIEGCRQVYALKRADEWTAALARWCDEQNGLLAFTGTCMVHRSEIMELRGAWADSLEEARRATERLSPRKDPQALAAAYYQLAEIRRLQGRYDAAEEAYRRSAEIGRDPQPGLALLRLAQGRTDAAKTAICRAMEAAPTRVQRARLLPACCEILLASEDIEAASRACVELKAIAESYRTEVFFGMASNACGMVALARGEPAVALRPLREALTAWQLIDAPYLAARTRVLLAESCRALGDQEGADLEFDTAGAVFDRLGAAPDVARLNDVRDQSGRAHGLTGRELQVLKLLASGKTNKTIARELDLSVRTVDRHVGNLLLKLDVPSRAAATAFGYDHGLVSRLGGNT